MAGPDADADADAGQPARRATDGHCECSICHEPLFEAMTAPCGHALCPPCVEGLMRAARGVAPQQLARGIVAQVPRCPECRVAVHHSQYRRCYALEKAAQALYPEKWNELASASAKSKNPMDSGAGKPGGEINDLKDLQAWKAAQEERSVEDVVQLIWKSIKGCMANSSALLISGNVALQQQPPPAPTRSSMFAPPFGQGWRGSPARLHISDEGEVDISEFVSQDAKTEVENVLTTLWSCTDEIRRRLERDGLKLVTFRFLGVEHALVTWPPIPSTFSSAK